MRSTEGSTRQQEHMSENQPGDWRSLPKQERVDMWRSAYGGVSAAIVMLVAAWLVGRASGAEARFLLESLLPATRSFCGTMTLALGNILALMLTLLSLSASTDIDLKWAYYQRIKLIALIVTIVLIGAVLVYLMLNVPLSQSDTAKGTEGPWYAVMYYTTLLLASLLGGAFIAIALMLYSTVRDVIRAVSPGKSSRLVRSEENESE